MARKTRIPIQNIPIRTEIGREIRDIFYPQPNPGTFFMNIDFSAAEMHVLAQILQKEESDK